MAVKKRTKFQREADLALIAEMVLVDGLIATQIVTRLAEIRPNGAVVSRRQISYDLAELENRWKRGAEADIALAKGQELAKLGHLEREYWDAWKRSLETKKRTKQAMRRPGGQGTEGKGGTASVEEATEQRDGNPAFLLGVERVISKRVDLLGLDAPIKVEDVTERDVLVVNLPQPPPGFLAAVQGGIFDEAKIAQARKEAKRAKQEQDTPPGA